MTNKAIPIEISLQLTNKCNLQCIHCYADLDSVKNIKEYTLNEIFSLIDSLFKMGTRWIRLLGGEPLLRMDIGEIINYIKDKGIICELFSNGYFVQDKIDALKKIDFLNISIDGDIVTNDELRGCGSYAKALEALVLAKKHKINVRLHFVPTRYNIHTLEHIATLAKKYAVVFNVNEYAVPPEKELCKLKLSGEDYERLYSTIKELKKNGYPLLNSCLAMKYMDDYWPFPEMNIINKQDLGNINYKLPVICQMGLRHFFIDVDGNIYSCPRRWKYGINFKIYGIYNALKYAIKKDCVICRELGCAEISNIFALNPKAILQAVKYYLMGPNS